jgi:hypothetical protein
MACIDPADVEAAAAYAAAGFSEEQCTWLSSTLRYLRVKGP